MRENVIAGAEALGNDVRIHEDGSVDFWRDGEKLGGYTEGNFYTEQELEWWEVDVAEWCLNTLGSICRLPFVKMDIESAHQIMGAITLAVPDKILSVD